MIQRVIAWRDVEPYADVVVVDHETCTAVVREPELPDAIGNLLCHFTLEEIPDADRS